MSLWLLLIIVGVILLILGVAEVLATAFIWIGVAIVIISLILSIVGRGKNRV